MPRKIPLTEMRQWLERYEAGTAETTIARMAKRDVRTVKRGIEQAKRERQAAQARLDLLKEAMRRHNDSLLRLIRDLGKVLKTPSPDQEVPLEPQLPDSPIAITGGWARYQDFPEPGIVALSLDIEEKPEWGLLEEHLKRDLVWKTLTAWKKALSSHLYAKVIMQRRLAQILEKETGCKLISDDLSVQQGIYRTSVGVLYRRLTARLPELWDMQGIEADIVADATEHTVTHGRGLVLARAPGEEERCRTGIIDALKKLLKSPEARTVVATFRELQDAVAKTREAVEALYLLGLVPGHCRVCRRLGI